MRGTALQTLRSVQREREEMLQHQSRASPAAPGKDNGEAAVLLLPTFGEQRSRQEHVDAQRRL